MKRKQEHVLEKKQLEWDRRCVSRKDWEWPPREAGPRQGSIGMAAHTRVQCLKAKAQNHKVKSILGHKVKPCLKEVWGIQEGGWT